MQKVVYIKKLRKLVFTRTKDSRKATAVGLRNFTYFLNYLSPYSRRQFILFRVDQRVIPTI